MRIFPTRKKMISALPNRGIVAEVGVQLGNFSHQILRKSRPRRLHLIDCWEQHHDDLDYPYGGCSRDQTEHDSNFEYVQQRFAEQIAQRQVKLHRGYSVPILQTFPDNYFDWVFIDANHSYAAVSEELAIVLPQDETRRYYLGARLHQHTPLAEPQLRRRRGGRRVLRPRRLGIDRQDTGPRLERRPDR